MKAFAALSGILFLTGCAGTAPEIADSACRSFKPISASKADTEPTRRQVVAHNKVYDVICKPLPAQPKATS